MMTKIAVQASVLINYSIITTMNYRLSNIPPSSLVGDILQDGDKNHSLASETMYSTIQALLAN